MENLLSSAQDIKIIFFDIDDTLRVKDTGYMPESVHRVFEALRQKGILTGIATGRNYYGVIPEIKALKPDFFVTANGAYVIDKDHDVIYNNPLPKQTVESLLAWLSSVDSDYIFYGSDNVVASRWSEVIQAAMAPVYGKLDVIPDYHQTHDIYQMLSISDHDDTLVLPDDLADKVRMVRWHPNSCDIVALNGSKADGVSHILASLGLSPKQVMNFGDELNDLELFKFGGLSVAMKVSHPDILAVADYVTDTVENDGIEKALKTLAIL
ncbi:MAG: Cof-type HAD-IIB family hydrolase [Lactococcus sp.]|uniref:Putative phosphatase n=1 Tax=Pseudolactococcus piscium MKFS47 TaxID=297352 RepID=A0A0D6DZ91_9LACT|nr:MULTISPECIES: Cof-type HAD-IIB family hydrolase [Lactococcus]MCJ1980023.1 Cof-type HAD-IIB family hydrolase [Lactococcus carnosus]MDN5403076.1 Cof-type HAD-IIB family hydrolase [Lactococcus sp.]MDN5409051.1 Cof-type HAD-IIB family hydrolase [Lactococcus sp.]MDN5411013.1 Cof-type HAD-IIB family hydrolase [Lactococcus sp.]MDN5435734.1 Cof-type HAD-IIB family hydrolase [Lactococcus sp.]